MVRRVKLSARGSVIVTILAVMIMLSGILFAVLTIATSTLLRSKGRVMLLEAQYAAESGVDVAIANLNNANTNYSGTASETIILKNSNYKATFFTTVANGSNGSERIVTATGKVYSPANATAAKYSRKIRVVVQRSSSTVTSSLTARNILYVDSGVKNIKAKDIYANGFIQMNKSTTNLIAETITVADRNTSASNCSIVGPGKLVMPSSFTTPGQTKTNVTLTYNNCAPISGTPSGSNPYNTSNSDFNITANSNSVAKIASTYIPWAQFMTTTQNRSCNDLSANLIGAPQTHTIPAVGTSDTHYPDSGSNTSAACGLLGDVYLGSDTYNITANVHIRASLCVVQVLGCTPTFNNPSPTLRWVFVEGAMDFNSIQTKPGSGPIVFVTYAADPLTQVLNCPYGGSMYLGNSGTTSAPAAYFIAMNGLCLNKTKFSSSPALGGLSGKNMYIATNPGTPFDLELDPLFPTNQIPTNLAWRAVRYERL